jgi:ketosteroid isomerase-like protein
VAHAGIGKPAQSETNQPGKPDMKPAALILLPLALLGCARDTAAPVQTATPAQPPAPAFAIAAVREHIAAANKVYGERFKQDDPGYYEARYTPDACAMPEKMPAVCSPDAIRAYYYNGGGNKDFNIVIEETAVYGGPEAVIEEGRYDFPDGKGGSFDKGKFIAVWKQEDGRWKLHREIWNSDIPAAAEP